MTIFKQKNWHITRFLPEILMIKESTSYKTSKKITHMWGRWTYLRISVWHLLVNLKNIYLLKKNCWSGPIKNVRILLFKMLYLFILGHPLPHPLQPGKSKFWKNVKIAWRCHHLIPAYQKSWSNVCFLRCKA